MARTPATPADLIELLRARHATVMGARPDKHPGVFKTATNQAGSTVFVAPELVQGTLIQGFDLYRSLEQPGANPLRDAHAALDAAVRAAYGMGKNEDILTHLLALNHACAEKEKAGEKITPPGLPLPPDEHAAFITTDCIEAPDHDDSTMESYGAAAHHHLPLLREEAATYKVTPGSGERS